MLARKVLVVDDSSTVRATVQWMLRGQEFELFMAEDGPRGLELAEREHPALILMDVEMPEMDGFEVCRQLRRNDSTRDIPVILVTSHNKQVDLARGYESGCTLYLTKPFDSERLRGVVRRFLARPGPGRPEAGDGVR